MNHAETQQQLLETLAEVLRDDNESPIRTVEQIDAEATFAELGVNSIDLLSFVMLVEERFDVVLLDELDPEELPDTIAGWTRWFDQHSRER